MGTLRCSTLLSLFGLSLVSGWAQETPYESRFKIQYQKFTRGDNERVMNPAEGRLEWFRERMGGDPSAEFMHHIALEAQQQRERFASHFMRDRASLEPSEAWRCIGPTSANFTMNGTVLRKVDAGRLRTILVDDTDTTGNTVYVLSAGGGLWKTTNFLATEPAWSPMTDFIGSTAGGALSFGKANSTLFLGVGDAFDSNVGGFVVKSSNGGQDWDAPVPLGNAKRVLDLQVDTTQATEIILAGTEVGLFRSTDGGITFSAIQSGAGEAFADSRVWSILRTSSGWLASVQPPPTPANATTNPPTAAAAVPSRFYLSTDRGATWNAVAGTPAGMGRTTLGIGQPGDPVVYAFAADTADSKQLDLFRSADGGRSWTALGLATKKPINANTDQSDMDIMKSQAFYNHMLLVDPSDATRNTLYLGGQLSAAKSLDGGKTWKIISNWLAKFTLPYVHADMHCAAFSNVGGQSRLYFGTDGGLFTSTDGGTTFDDTKNKGQVNHLIFALASNPEIPDSTIVGLQDNGTRLREGATTIFNQPKGGDGFGVGWSQKGSAASLCSYVYSKISVSTANPPDDQTKWSLFTTGISEVNNSSTNYFVTALSTAPATADPSGQTFFHNTRSTIYRTINAAATTRSWTAIGKAGTAGLPTGNIVRAGSHGVACSPTDRNKVSVCGTSGRVFLTKDGGSSWSTVDMTAQIPGWPSYNASIAWASDDLLYLCSEAPTPASGTVRVAKSTDGGLTWVSAGSDLQGLAKIPLSKLVVDPGDATGKTVYAATWLGVYRTTDGGESWALFGTGLPQVRVSDLYIAPDSSYLRVSTWGRGVWEVKNGTTTPNPTVAVAISPSSASVKTNATFQFSASVSGSTNTAVNWTATKGSVDAAGLYTAPASAGTAKIRATSVADTTKFSEASVTITEPVSQAGELILNGAFEQGATAWNGNTACIGAWSSQPPFEGSQSALLCGKGKKTTHNLSQTVNIPANATSATLSFYYRVQTSEILKSRVFDTLALQVLSATGTVLATPFSVSNVNPTSGYVQKVVDLSAYKGQTVKLNFKGVEDVSKQTSFSLDKVSLIVN